MVLIRLHRFYVNVSHRFGHSEGVGPSPSCKFHRYVVLNITFGGGIETVAFEHKGTRKRSALAHTMAAAETAAVSLKAARESVTTALRAVI